MLIYISPIILACLGLLLRSRNLLLFLASFLAFIVGMGVNVGADYPAYMLMQASSPSLFDSNFKQEFILFYEENGMEIIFTFFTVLIKTLGLNDQYIFLLMSTLSSFFIYKICKKFNIQIAFVVFLAIYLLTFSGLWTQIRYGLAILMVFYACIIFAEKKYFPALLLVALAAGIHSISLAIFIVLLSYEVLRRINVSIPIIALAVLFISLVFLSVDVKPIIMLVMQHLNPRYAAYEETGGTQMNYLIRLIFCASLFMLLSKSNIKNDNKFFMFFILVAWSLIIWSLAWRIDVLYRVGVMFEFGYLLFVIRSAYLNSTYFLVGTLLLIFLLIWRLAKAMDTLNEYSFYLFAQ